MTTQSHWLCLHPSDNIANEASTALSLNNRGLAYADGFFTTIGVIDGQVLWPEYHHQRLISHAHALQLAIDAQALSSSLPTHAKQLQQGVLKLIITRVPQDIVGYGFSVDAAGSACEVWLRSTPMSLTSASSSLLPNDHSIPLQLATKSVCLTSQLACLPPTLAGLKSLNRLDNVLASGELQRLRATLDESVGEGLVRDMSGDWVEGTMSNVFYQLTTSNNLKSNNPNYLLSGQWFTPSMTRSGVAGVMRQVIIDALATTENPVVIRPLADADLTDLTQLFFCNAVRGVMPVSSLTLLNGEVVRLS